jgi:ribosomal protein S18 acetylase RimI-like enzyme
VWEKAAGAGQAWSVTRGEQAPDVVERLVRDLPEWFGIEASNREYVAAAGHRLTYLARSASSSAGAGGAPAGALLVVRHFPASAEIYWLGVSRNLHRQGVGHALVSALEADLIAEGVSFLFVKTLGPSHPDAGYAKTRLFYEAMGFAPLEELHDLWGPDNPCLIMIKALRGPSYG